MFTALDVRDDTMHLFLGPYHLCLGPALCAAYRFRHLSNALLAASSAKKTTNDLTSIDKQRRRRREMILRRFRRIVRKLTMIKSILHQLRLTSILTPYNQYELINNGIYDLVLAGHQSNASMIFDDQTFVEEIEHLRPMTHPDDKSFLLTSNFIKMNTLLHLLSTSHQDESNRSANLPLPEPLSTESDEKGSEMLLDTTTMCCAQHNQYSPMIKLPTRTSMLSPTVQLTTKKNNTHGSQRSSLVLTRQNTVSISHRSKKHH